jgi:uncharacterized membrane protein
MNLGQLFAGLVATYTVVIAIATFLIHTAFAFAVERDARSVKQRGGQLVLVGPFVWAFGTFVGGPFVAVAYWLVHHSMLGDKHGPNNGNASP